MPARLAALAPLLAPVLVLAPLPATAQTTATGSDALALAAAVGEADPALSTPERAALRRLIEGGDLAAAPRLIVVRAASVLCRKSNVDITAVSCDLGFPGRTVTETGARARALAATLGAACVQGEGAAGSTYLGLTALVCRIAPGVIAERAGGGADCAFGPTP